MAVIRRAGRVMGKVQGVGFRAFVQSAARELGFTGWTRNMPDGSVVLEAQGDEARFGAFQERLRQGNGLCRVDHMVFEYRTNAAGETDFEIRR